MITEQLYIVWMGLRILCTGCTVIPIILAAVYWLIKIVWVIRHEGSAGK